MPRTGMLGAPLGGNWARLRVFVFFFWHGAFSQMPAGRRRGEHRCASRAYRNKVPDLRAVINLFPTVANQVQDRNGERRKLGESSQLSPRHLELHMDAIFCLEIGVEDL